MIKHSSHSRALEKCRKHSNDHRVLSQCNTRPRLLYLLNIYLMLTPLCKLNSSFWTTRNFPYNRKITLLFGGKPYTHAQYSVDNNVGLLVGCFLENRTYRFETEIFDVLKCIKPNCKGFRGVSTILGNNWESN